MAGGVGAETGSTGVGRRLGVLALVALAILAPRLPGLDRFITIDEPRWLARSANFYAALGSRDWAGTYQSEHPGVTTTWAGAIAILLGGPGQAELAGGGFSAGEYRRLLERSGQGQVGQLALSRLVMVLANAAALVTAFPYAWRLLGPAAATVGFLLIAFDPFHLAHSRLLHLDGLQGSLTLLVVLAFLGYLENRRARDLVLSGLAAGLNCLTRSPCVLLAPAIALLALLDWWPRRPGARPHAPDAEPPPRAGSSPDRRAGGQRAPRGLASVAGPLLAWAAVLLATFVLLWPAMWVDPAGSVLAVAGASLDYARSGHNEALFFRGQIVPDGRLDASFFDFYPLTFLWRTTPVVLAGLLAAVAALIGRRPPLDRPRTRFTVVGLLVTAALLALELNLAAKKFDRYLLPAYPLLDLVAAAGWVALAGWLRSLFPGRALRHAGLLAIGTALVVQAAGSLATFPYYLSYYNPLLGGSRRAPETMMIGWGEGLDEAARYLNAQAGAAEITVAASYRPAFAPFFDGASASLPTEEDLGQAPMERALAADYVVTYANHWQRDLCRPLYPILAGREPEYTVWIDGLEYVRIYKMPRPSSSTTTLAGIHAASRQPPASLDAR